MDEKKPDLQPVTPSLKGAIRRARIEEAERMAVLAELRGAEIARLEMLAEALEPVFAQVPEDVDIFDAGVVPGERPRLYIDMVGLIEMGEDKRTYHFVQNTRHGRIALATSDKMDAMIDAVTNYVARRLIEREQALAGDRTIEEAALIHASTDRRVQSTAAAMDSADTRARRPETEPRPGRFWNAIVEGVIFVAELIGFVVLLVALFGALYFGWTLAEAWWVAWFNKAA